MSIEELTAALSARCNDLADKHKPVQRSWGCGVAVNLISGKWSASASVPPPDYSISSSSYSDPSAALDEIDALLSARAAANPTQEQLAATLDVPVLP